MTINPVKRHREKKEAIRQQQLMESHIRFMRYTHEVLSEMSKNGHNFNA